MCRNPKDWFWRECGFKAWFMHYIIKPTLAPIVHPSVLINHEKNDDLISSSFICGIAGRPVFFLTFKIILLIYWSILWSWRLVDFHILAPAAKWELNKNYTRTREYSDYLTNWGDTLIMLYLLYSTFLAIRLFYLKSRKDFGDIGDATMAFGERRLKWYYFPAQILLEIAANLALLITILYFGLMGGGDLTDILNIHPHIMNCKFNEKGIFRFTGIQFSAVVIIFELAYNRIPFRFFHFIFPMLVALMYTLGNWIGYKMNPARNGVYPGIVDWSDNQAKVRFQPVQYDNLILV